MEEDDLQEELTDFFNRIEALENSVCDLNHRIESIESAMEKMLDILRAHDDLHEQYKQDYMPSFVKT